MSHKRVRRYVKMKVGYWCHLLRCDQFVSNITQCDTIQHVTSGMNQDTLTAIVTNE